MRASELKSAVYCINPAVAGQAGQRNSKDSEGEEEPEEDDEEDPPSPRVLAYGHPARQGSVFRF